MGSTRIATAAAVGAAAAGAVVAGQKLADRRADAVDTDLAEPR